ncbi:unnamed protein product (macronuclear) [Paramecium tetraurelia]|uniref:RING-type domain-containing protein n=1 Tax=Paramecium tetraurelia TaxID=5888 RepID=A0EHV3_PARTE|nr:uncharacterized protein GSPATT00027221001 [Paramecium tetraurelia]CAK94894.1 unnamed protein product [Paramecium tetraurelia]|eukprot:XP_001462267.1 hypothetical protein (macronuclear) [Paramecium tetraurelia strain d4-2]
MGICAPKQLKKTREYYSMPKQHPQILEPQKLQEPLQHHEQIYMLDKESNIQHMQKYNIPPDNQSNHIQQQQIVERGNSIYKQNQNTSQILISDVCKKCQKHIGEAQKVVIQSCNHLYDINCFTDHFKEHKTCCTETKIIINQAKYPKAQVNEIMKHKLKQLIANIKNNIVVQCPTQFCSFLFIYRKEYNKNQKKKFYCQRCQQEMVYDGKMCKFIDLQTVQNDNNVSDTQIYLKLETIQFGCQIQDHLRVSTNQIILPCNHDWCKKCLFVNYKDCLTAVCHCGHRYPKNIFDQISDKEEWNDIYDRQLQIIMWESKYSWQFCKNNCGFFFECKNMDDDCYCIKCDSIKTCNKCKKEIYSQYIQVNQCNHYYHLLCSFSLLMENNLKNLSCLCNQKIDNDIKVEMNIICIICQKYEDNLIMLQCCHFIHQECLENNLQAFSSFRCNVCLIPIDNIIYEPRLLSIRDKLISMKKYSNQNNLLKSDIVFQNKQEANLVGNQQLQQYHNQQVIINNNYGYK